MKVLYVTINSPWAQKDGGRIRSCNILRLLAERHQVITVLLNDCDAEISEFLSNPKCEAPCRVVRRARSCTRAICLRKTLERCRHLLNADERAAYAEGLQEVIAGDQPDVIWFYHLNALWRSDWQRLRPPVVCDMVDFESHAYARAIRRMPLMKRLVAWFDYPRFVRAEFATAQACRVLLGSNPQEVSESQERFGRPVIYVPNGFEFPSTPPVYERRVEPRFIFVGTLPYGPNLDGVRWFVREIWPRIRGVLPNATINVVGSYSGIESIVKQLSRQPGVRFTGYSTDLESMLRHAACLVVPLRLGGGTRIKIIEAWARGLPVVSTSIGCEGLGAVHLQTLFIADDPRRFADECLNLVRSPERGQRVARCAYDYGRSHFAWRCVAEDLERALCVATSLGRLDTANSHPT